MTATTLLSANTNTPAIVAQLNLQRNQSALNLSLERLSTGLQINRSSDNPSGLVISEFQRSQIAGLSQAVVNVDRAISLSQTAEGGLSEIQSLLTDLRALAIDSANNGALDAESLAANQANVDNILDSVDRIANNTRFGTFNLLDGSSGLLAISTDTSQVTFVSALDTAAAANSPAVLSVDISRAATRTNAAAALDQAANTLAQDEALYVNDVRIDLTTGMSQADVVARVNEFSGQTGVTAAIPSGGGATIFYANEFGPEGSKVSVFSLVAAAAGTSGVGTTPLTATTGVDVAGTIGGGTATGHGRILTGNVGQAGSGVSVQIAVDTDPTTTVAPTGGTAVDIVLVDDSRSFQIGAFAGTANRATLTLNKSDSIALGGGVTGNQFASLRDINVQTSTAANDALAVIDRAIADVASLRGDVGAFQTNTLEATQSNLQTQLTNMQSAESVLRDTNYATEITNFTSNQIRLQAATTVLGLANQNSLAILNLLQGGQQ